MGEAGTINGGDDSTMKEMICGSAVQGSQVDTICEVVICSDSDGETWTGSITRRQSRGPVFRRSLDLQTSKIMN